MDGNANHVAKLVRRQSGSSKVVSAESVNWKIQLFYTRHEFEKCLSLIELQLKRTKGLCEHAIFVKGLIKRSQGKIDESLELFQAATCLNPGSRTNLKQVARSLHLLGKPEAALGVLREVAKFRGGERDWNIWHYQGLCLMQMKDFKGAIECFQNAISIQRNDVTYLQMGKAQVALGDLNGAMESYQEALEFSPENPELLTTIGLLYLKLGDNTKAFVSLGNSLAFDPKNTRTILAAGSIIQDHQDTDAALVKYRVAATQAPNSPQLWNNIGMCFFTKQRFVAAIACLKRALYLHPFEWIISFNLGLVHLHTGQYASSFHYLSACINLKPSYPATYMYLAITLNRLSDFDNACAAYEKAISLRQDHLFYLNYAITLFNAGKTQQAKVQFVKFKKLFQSLSRSQRQADQDLFNMQNMLTKELLGDSSTAPSSDDLEAMPAKG